MRLVLVMILWLVLAGGMLLRAAFALDGNLTLEGAEIVLRLGDGRVLRREGLVGLTLVLGSAEQNITVRIDGVDEDRTVPGDPLILYRLSALNAKTGAAADMCLSDPQGRRAAVAYPDGRGGFNLTCTSGAEGKCILFGYRPWQSREGIPMQDLHQACIHMVRADYGGDNQPTTRDGTLVNIYDRFGIQKRDPDAGTTFEAAWGANGAICIARPRIPENISLDELAARYLHLKDRLGPQACSAEAVRSDPRALILNESMISPSLRQ